MSSLHRSNHIYFHDEKRLQGYLSYDEKDHSRRPLVLVVHDWSGRNAFACQKADFLAKLGYVGFAVDMYGDAQIGETVDEKTALMQSVAHDRSFLRARMLAALNTASQLEQVDHHRIAVIGFCFGGLCALDLARSGAEIRGAVSFHGILNNAEGLATQPIKAKILALHGYDDPLVKPDQVNAFCREMTDAGADWQVHMYGHTQHAFTNPSAHDASHGLMFNTTAEHRSMQAMTNFLKEIFI